MTPKVLDRMLRQLSNEELLYKENKIQPQYMEKDIVYRGGIPYYKMKYTRNDLRGRLFEFQFHPYILIRRHDRFAPVREHVHNGWIELGYMYSGSCEQTINDAAAVTLNEGQMLILDSNASHSIGNTAENDILIELIMDRGFFTDNFFSHFSKENILLKFLLNAISEKAAHENYILFPSENSSRIRLFMRELMSEYLSPPNDSSVDVVNNLLNLIFLELVRVYRSDTVFSELKLGKSNIIAVLNYIEANYRVCTLTSTAEFFNMNPNYLSTILKKRTGQSFKELVQNQRFLYVKTMLRNTRIPVDELIADAGYVNTSYFYKKFKQRYGCSPKQYREESFNRLEG